MLNDVEYATGEKASCPSGKCVRAGVNIQSGTLTDSDCYDRFILETSYVHAAEVSLTMKSFHFIVHVNLFNIIDLYISMECISVINREAPALRMMFCWQQPPKLQRLV